MLFHKLEEAMDMLEEGWSCAGSGRGAEVCRQCLVSNSTRFLQLRNLSYILKDTDVPFTMPVCPEDPD